MYFYLKLIGFKNLCITSWKYDTQFSHFLLVFWHYLDVRFHIENTQTIVYPVYMSKLKLIDLSSALIDDPNILKC